MTKKFFGDNEPHGTSEESLGGLLDSSIQILEEKLACLTTREDALELIPQLLFVQDRLLPCAMHLSSRDWELVLRRLRRRLDKIILGQSLRGGRSSLVEFIAELKDTTTPFHVYSTEEDLHDETGSH